MARKSNLAPKPIPRKPLCLEWEAEQHRRDEEPGSYTLRLPWLNAIVHRHIHYPPDQWLLSCHQIGIEGHELTSKPIAGAQHEAMCFLRERLCEYVKAVDAYLSK